MHHYFQNKFKFLNTYFFRCNYSSFFKLGLLKDKKKFKILRTADKSTHFTLLERQRLFLQLVLSRDPRISLEATPATTDRHLMLENKEVRLPKITCCKLWGIMKNDHPYKTIFLLLPIIAIWRKDDWHSVLRFPVRSRKSVGISDSVKDSRGLGTEQHCNASIWGFAVKKSWMKDKTNSSLR